MVRNQFIKERMLVDYIWINLQLEFPINIIMLRRTQQLPSNSPSGELCSSFHRETKLKVLFIFSYPLQCRYLDYLVVWTFKSIQIKPIHAFNGPSEDIAFNLI